MPLINIICDTLYLTILWKIIFFKKNWLFHFWIKSFTTIIKIHLDTISNHIHSKFKIFALHANVWATLFANREIALQEPLSVIHNNIEISSITGLSGAKFSGLFILCTAKTETLSTWVNLAVNCNPSPIATHSTRKRSENTLYALCHGANHFTVLVTYDSLYASSFPNWKKTEAISDKYHQVKVFT